MIGSLAQQPCRFQARFLQQPVRPSPQSQSLSRGYGSNLPTSLTYIVLSTRGCSPWRPAADIGTALARESHCRPRIFKGRRERTGHRGKRGALRSHIPYLGASPFQGVRSLTKKRELFPGLPPASPGLFALPLLAPGGADLRGQVLGMLTRFPFDLRLKSLARIMSLLNGVPRSLRTD